MISNVECAIKSDQKLLQLQSEPASMSLHSNSSCRSSEKEMSRVEHQHSSNPEDGNSQKSDLKQKHMDVEENITTSKQCHNDREGLCSVTNPTRNQNVENGDLQSVSQIRDNINTETQTTELEISQNSNVQIPLFDVSRKETATEEIADKTIDRQNSFHQKTEEECSLSSHQLRTVDRRWKEINLEMKSFVVGKTDDECKSTTDETTNDMIAPENIPNGVIGSRTAAMMFIGVKELFC